MDEQPLTVGEGPESNATAARGTAIITWAGLIIIYLSVAAFGLVGFLLYRTAGLARADLYKYTPEFMVSAIGVFAALLGVKLVRAGGLSPSDPLPVVNPVEWRILSAALTKCDEDPIGQYIRLSSLTGATGFFTKLGLSGLPLATIALTLFFALGSLVPSCRSRSAHSRSRSRQPAAPAQAALARAPAPALARASADRGRGSREGARLSSWSVAGPSP